MSLEKRVAYWSDFGFTHYRSLFNFQRNLSQLRLQNKIPDTIIFSEHYPIIRFGNSNINNRFSKKFLDFIKRIYGKSSEEYILRYLNDLGIDFMQGSIGGQAAYIGPGQLVTYPIVDYTKIVERGLDLSQYKFLIDEIMYEVLKNDFGLNAQIVQVAEEFKKNRKGLRKDRKDVWLKLNGKSYKIGGKGIVTNRSIAYNGFTFYIKPYSISGFEFIDPCGYDKEQLDVTCIENELKREVSINEVKEVVLKKIKKRFNYDELNYIETEDLERINQNSTLFTIPSN